MCTKAQVQPLAWPLDESQVLPLTSQPHAQKFDSLQPKVQVFFPVAALRVSEEGSHPG